MRRIQPWVQSLSYRRGSTSGEKQEHGEDSERLAIIVF